MTITAVQPEGRFGVLDLMENRVRSFVEKPQGDGAWVSGGFFVCEPALLDYIDGDSDILERTCFERLVQIGQIAAFKHHGFWYCMDTLRDKQHLESLWRTGKAPWKIW